MKKVTIWWVVVLMLWAVASAAFGQGVVGPVAPVFGGNQGGGGGSVDSTNANFLGGSHYTTYLKTNSSQFFGNAATATTVQFSEQYTAWVSKSGDDSTGTVGKRELPFLTVSNAVFAVKSALGSTTTNGTVYIGAGLFAETWVNLQRTNLPGISLMGSGATTLLTGTSDCILERYGPLVTVGHSSRVCNLSISNNVEATVKQAAIGWDTSRSTTNTTTLVCPTNVYICAVNGRGSSDVGYFYDAGTNGGGQAGNSEMWIDRCNWVSSWDCFFNSTSGDPYVRVTQCSFQVLQPDGYSFPGGGSGSGRARAMYVANGTLSVEDSSIVCIGGNNATNEVTALTANTSVGVGYTNINTQIHASSRASSGTVTRESTLETPVYIFDNSQLVDATGTPATLAGSPALINFGTIDPSLTFSASGTYLICASVTLEYSATESILAGTFACTVKLRKTSGTPADIPGAYVQTYLPELVTAYTGPFIAPSINTIYTATAGDVIQLWGDCAPDAGSIIATQAKIVVTQIR